MATQNPIEQEGTFALPEAQLDRFLLCVKIAYPQAETETDILRLARERARAQINLSHGAHAAVQTKLSESDLFAAREAVLDVYLAPALERYLIELVLASRSPERYGNALAGKIAWGISPRGTIALERCARANAWLAGRDFVTPEDIHAVADDVLGHRLLPSYEALAEGYTGQRLVAELLRLVPLP